MEFLRGGVSGVAVGWVTLSGSVQDWTWPRCGVWGPWQQCQVVTATSRNRQGKWLHGRGVEHQKAQEKSACCRPYVPMGLLQWEPSRQPGGCSRLAALPDPCDIESFGRENLVEKSKSCTGSCFDYLFLTSLQMEKIPLVNVYLLFSYCFIILSALSRDK